MLLSNTLIYGDKLKCGTEAVAKQALKLPIPWKDAAQESGDHECQDGNCWLGHLLKEE